MINDRDRLTERRPASSHEFFINFFFTLSVHFALVASLSLFTASFSQVFPSFVRWIEESMKADSISAIYNSQTYCLMCVDMSVTHSRGEVVAAAMVIDRLSWCTSIVSHFFITNLPFANSQYSHLCFGVVLKMCRCLDKNRPDTALFASDGTTLAFVFVSWDSSLPICLAYDIVLILPTGYTLPIQT